VFLLHGSQSPPRAGDIPHAEDAAEGVREAVARQPADSKLTLALGVIVKGMDPAKEKIEEPLIWIQVIDSTRLKRNLVGHCAGKRYNGHGVDVFASKSIPQGVMGRSWRG
jgi:hypothetical protein